MKIQIVQVASALALATVACTTTPEEKPTAPPPELASQELNVKQNLTTFKLDFQGELKSQEAATLQAAKWELVVDGEVVKTGEQPLDVSVPAGGSAPFSLNVQSEYVSSAEELKAMSERGGSLLTALRGNLIVNQGGTKHELPFARSREVRTPRMPSVKLHELDAARYSEDEANIVFYLGVVNPNPFPLDVQGLDYKVMVADKELATGTRARGDAIQPAATGVFEVQVGISEKTMGADVKKLIKTLTLPYKVTGELKGDLFAVPYTIDGAVKLNVSK